MLSNSTTQKHKTKISQTNIILGVILAVLVVVVLVIGLLTRTGSDLTPLSGLGDRVDTIEITRLGETNTLVWQVDKWVVANHNNQLAKQDYVLDIFSTLDELVVNNIISNNPDKRSVYQVDDNGIQVVMKSGEKVVQYFVVGKNGPSWPSSYLRWQDEDEVYLVRETLPQIFGWSEWRNMTIIQLGNDLIQSLKWSNGLEVVKEEGVWKTISPKEIVVEEVKIKTVLDNINSLEAIDIANIKAWDLNQQDADFILEITTTDDVSYRLAFWNHPKESLDELGTSASLQGGDYDYYVVRENDDNVYVLSKYVAENMEKKIEFLED